MQCEECGRTMLKDENQCPFCGYVYGPSKSTQFLMLIGALVAIYLVWKFWIAA